MKLVWAGIRREKGTAQAHKKPALTKHIREMLEHLPTNTLGVRDRALILLGYAGAMRRSELVGLDVTRDRRQRIDLCLANLWSHGNEAGSRENLANVLPFLLRARTGIIVYTAGDFPLLSLLGLRVIGENGLVIHPKYAKFDTSGLTREVKAGPTDFPSRLDPAADKRTADKRPGW